MECPGVLEIKENEMCGGVGRRFYPDICSEARAPYWPHPFPLHTTRLKYPHTGWSSHNILVSSVVNFTYTYLILVASISSGASVNFLTEGNFTQNSNLRCFVARQIYAFLSVKFSDHKKYVKIFKKNMTNMRYAPTNTFY